MHRKMVLALQPNTAPREAEQLAESDWARDAEGQPYLDRDRFAWTFFELADLYTPSLAGDDYADFLRRLTAQITRGGDGGTRQARVGGRREGDAHPLQPPRARAGRRAAGQLHLHRMLLQVARVLVEDTRAAKVAPKGFGSSTGRGLPPPRGMTSQLRKGAKPRRPAPLERVARAAPRPQSSPEPSRARQAASKWSVWRRCPRRRRAARPFARRRHLPRSRAWRRGRGRPRRRPTRPPQTGIASRRRSSAARSRRRVRPPPVPSATSPAAAPAALPPPAGSESPTKRRRHARAAPPLPTADAPPRAAPPHRRRALPPSRSPQLAAPGPSTAAASPARTKLAPALAASSPQLRGARLLKRGKAGRRRRRRRPPRPPRCCDAHRRRSLLGRPHRLRRRHRRRRPRGPPRAPRRVRSAAGAEGLSS